MSLWQSGFHRHTPLHAGPVPFHLHKHPLFLGLFQSTGRAEKAERILKAEKKLSQSTSVQTESPNANA